MLSNNKFLGKCWLGRHPWIRLAMESESMVEKGINFIFCLGTAYGISIMESIGNYSIIFVDRKSMPPKMFLSLSFSLWVWNLCKSLLPSVKRLSFTLCNFFTWVSILSYKAPTKGHYDCTWALVETNMRVCSMNGLMIEHNGLGITCF